MRISQTLWAQTFGQGRVQRYKGEKKMEKPNLGRQSPENFRYTVRILKSGTKKIKYKQIFFSVFHLPCCYYERVWLVVQGMLYEKYVYIISIYKHIFSIVNPSTCTFLRACHLYRNWRSNGIEMKKKSYKLSHTQTIGE